MFQPCPFFCVWCGSDVLNSQVSAIVDGLAPSSNAASACYPTEVIATMGGAGSYITTEGAASGPQLHTTSNETLSQSFAYLDSFQVRKNSALRRFLMRLAFSLSRFTETISHVAK